MLTFSRPMLVEIVVFERVRECPPECMQVKLGIDERISQHPPDCIPVVFPGHHKQGIVLNEETGNDSGAGWKLERNTMFCLLLDTLLTTCFQRSGLAYFRR